MPPTDGRRSNKKPKRSFAGIPREVMDSHDYQSLGGNSVKLLLELANQYRGKNNGDLTCAWTVLKEKGWKSKSTIERARNQLFEKNLIIKSRESYFHSSGGHCALYALTWLPVDECNGKLDIPPTKKPRRIFSDYYEQDNRPRNEVSPALENGSSLKLVK